MVMAAESSHFFASSIISRMISREILWWRLAVGSSTRKSSEACVSVRTMPTGWRCPPESASARWCPPFDRDLRGGIETHAVEKAGGPLDVAAREAAE